MTPYEQLKALVEAGREATQGEWEADKSVKWDAVAIMTSLGKICRVYYPYKTQNEGLVNAHFIAQSANTRPALEELLKLLGPIEGIEVPIRQLDTVLKHKQEVGGKVAGVHVEKLGLLLEAAKRFQKMTEGL